VIDEPQRLAQPGAAFGRQGDLVVLAVIVDAFETPHLAADLHHLGAAQR
jgi:hypothetical protein